MKRIYFVFVVSILIISMLASSSMSISISDKEYLKDNIVTNGGNWTGEFAGEIGDSNGIISGYYQMKISNRIGVFVGNWVIYASNVRGTVFGIFCKHLFFGIITVETKVFPVLVFISFTGGQFHGRGFSLIGRDVFKGAYWEY